MSTGLGSVCLSVADLSSGYFSVIPFGALRLPDPEAVLRVEQGALWVSLHFTVVNVILHEKRTCRAGTSTGKSPEYDSRRDGSGNQQPY